MSVTLAGTLPGDDRNGLAALAGRLVDDPEHVHVVVALVDCTKITTKVESGDQIPTARIRAIEPIAAHTDAAEMQRLLRRRPAVTGEREAPLVFVDCESDGVHPGRRVWEIAMIRRDHHGAADVEEHFFVDIDLSTADPFGLRVGRFYDRHPLGRWLSDHDRVATEDFPVPEDEHTDYLSAEAAARLVARAAHRASPSAVCRSSSPGGSTPQARDSSSERHGSLTASASAWSRVPQRPM